MNSNYTRKTKFSKVRIGQTFMVAGESTLFIKIQTLVSGDNARRVVPGKTVHKQFLPDDPVLVLEHDNRQ